MNQKVEQRCVDVVAPSLAAGERIELVEVLQCGRLSAKRVLWIAVVVAVLSLGTLMARVKLRAYFVVLADRRLFLIDNINGQVGKHVVAAIPRGSMKAGPLRTHLLTVSMEVEADDEPAPWRFSWGRAQSDVARRFAAAFGGPVPVG